MSDVRRDLIARLREIRRMRDLPVREDASEGEEESEEQRLFPSREGRAARGRSHRTRRRQAQRAKAEPAQEDLSIPGTRDGALTPGYLQMGREERRAILMRAASRRGVRCVLSKIDTMLLVASNCYSGKEIRILREDREFLKAESGKTRKRASLSLRDDSCSRATVEGILGML